MKQLLCLLFLMAGALYCNAQKFKPALNLVKDSSYYLNFTVNSQAGEVVDGQQNTINIGYVYKMAFKVLAVSDSVYNMEVTIRSVSMKIEMAGFTTEIDTKKNDPQDTLSTIMSGIVNKPFNTEITKKGRVKSVTNLDKLLDILLNSEPADAKRQQARALFTQSFGLSAFRGSLEAGIAIFPDAPIAKDDKWVINTTFENTARVAVRINYRLTDIAAGLYIIHGEGTLTSEKDAAPSQVNGMPVKYDLNGSVISDIRVDKKTGWIREAKMKQIMMGSMQILDNPKLPGGMTIPITYTTDGVTTNK